MSFTTPKLEVKRRPGGANVLLSLVVSFLLLAGTPYFAYCNLAGTDFHSSDLSFETTDQEHPFGHRNQLEAVGSSDLFGSCFLEGSFFEPLVLNPFHASRAEDITLCLRC